MKSPHDLALLLIEKAAHDLVAGEATIATGDALDMVCFHAQQAVEKSLKALLALKDVEYPWRHDLLEQLTLVKPLFPEVGEVEEDLVKLSPYAVDIRYDDELTPDLEEARSALDVATKVHALAKRLVQPDAPGASP
jgi:HEPN domain-containing protein